MRVLGLIPARGGSKGIHRKNVRMLGTKPLIAYTIETALQSRLLDTLVVSTDDPAIAEISETWGAAVPFIRPDRLATDETATLPVVQHAIEILQPRVFDAVCLLQATQPFRHDNDIDAAISLLVENELASSVISVSQVPTDFHPDWAYKIDKEGQLQLYSGALQPPMQRQALEPAYFRNGSIYLTRTQVIQQGSLYGVKPLPIITQTGINLDSEQDWQAAEQFLRTDTRSTART